MDGCRTRQLRNPGDNQLIAMSSTDQLYGYGNTLYFTTHAQTRLWSMGRADNTSPLDPSPVMIEGNRPLVGISNVIEAERTIAPNAPAVKHLVFTAADLSDNNRVRLWESEANGPARRVMSRLAGTTISF